MSTVEASPRIQAPRFNRGWRRRLLLHHVPIALASALIVLVLMGFSLFTMSGYAELDTTSSAALPTARGMPIPPAHMEGHVAGLAFAFDLSYFSLSRFTIATGYVASGLLALTLVVGPANLLLRRRNRISSYLRRDLGAWTAFASVAHVVAGLQEHNRGQLGFLAYFFADGRPLTNSFGLGNWTGLTALLVVLGLLMISTDSSLSELKAKRWKNLQRLNYVLFCLVVLHAFFYGALLRMTSPFTVLLILLVGGVLVAQVLGVWLWRHRHVGDQG